MACIKVAPILGLICFLFEMAMININGARGIFQISDIAIKGAIAP
jgi:hypothetical protein